jgi:ADP-ribose pyrophosphatase YjhB (NUDIX family)
VEKHKKFSRLKLGNTNFHFMMKLPTVGLLVIENRKLLLAFSRNKQCFYLPGGKIDINETATKALCREITEEMNVSIHEQDLKYYTHVSAPAYGEENGTIMEQDCFLLQANITARASAEIGELRYFSLAEYLTEANQAPGAVMVLEQLKTDGYID